MSLDDLAYGLNELAEACPDYEMASAYYEGDQEDLYGSTALEARLRRDAELYRLNLAKTPVNVVADRLEVAAVTVPEDTKATELIAAVWADNRLDLHSDDWTRKACEYGDSYVYAWPELDGDGDETGRVELALFEPTDMRVLYDPEHPNRKWYAIQRMKLTDGRIRVNLIYPDRIERYVAPKGTKPDDRAAWKPFDGDGWVSELVNPYGAIPIFHFRTGAPYGRPEHKDAYGPQSAINKAFVTQVGTMVAAGFPTLWALQDAEAVLDAASDDPDFDDDADDMSESESVTGVGQGSKLRSAPGSLNWLQGVNDLLRFDGADPDTFLKPMTATARLMSQVTDTPTYRLDFGGEIPSGASLKVSNLPLDAKVATRQKWFGAEMKALWTFVLAKILSHEPKGSVDIRWKPPAVVQGLEDWQVASAKRDAGVPETQVLLEAGYGTDQVAEWQAGDREAMDLMRRATIIKELGAGVQALSAGVVAGVLDQSLVTQLLAKLLDDATPPDPGNGD